MQGYQWNRGIMWMVPVEWKMEIGECLLWRDLGVLCAGIPVEPWGQVHARNQKKFTAHLVTGLICSWLDAGTNYISVINWTSRKLHYHNKCHVLSRYKMSQNREAMVFITGGYHFQMAKITSQNKPTVKDGVRNLSHFQNSFFYWINGDNLQHTESFQLPQFPFQVLFLMAYKSALF